MIYIPGNQESGAQQQGRENTDPLPNPWGGGGSSTQSGNTGSSSSGTTGGSTQGGKEM